MNAALRAFVRERAGRRCEYCRLHEDDADFLSFHVEHVVAKQHGGTDDADILCFACAECNWAKGPNLAGLLGGKLYPLFNPRKQSWKRQFRWDNAILVGKTFCGKAACWSISSKRGGAGLVCSLLAAIALAVIMARLLTVAERPSTNSARNCTYVHIERQDQVPGETEDR